MIWYHVYTERMSGNQFMGTLRRSILPRRLFAAWLVLIGKADAVIWE